ncbi:MAG: hypothetical protein HOE35_02375 [Candidatus Ruthia sp.]|jgi:hypothetical protein|nr:hypothetical protein [Candidatus Ruthturnera sp.]MBT4122759.1 hypothetical protein [Candidatus Ruthturnera sp.]MBT4668560.1 hypothetical protein [Candidatus Ruthturnera sp.]MBT6922550.1 hypothetical protein [Candidatus Ruthturnera sp.]
MKKILTYLLLLITITIIAFVVFFDGLAKSAIEAYAQKSLKTPVSIAEFRSDLSVGKIDMDFIEVKNPSTFKNENAFVLNHLSAVISAESNEDLIIVDSLEFDGLLFSLEQNEKQVNLVALLKNLEQESNNSSQNTTTSNVEKNEQSETRVIIKDLQFINTQLKIDTQWFKDTVDVPTVIVRHFGGEKGIPLNLVGAELMKTALRRIQNEVENQGLKLGEKEIKEGIRRQLEGELEGLKGKLDGKARGWMKKLGL